MRVAIIGQQAFGKAVLEAFIARGHQVAAVFLDAEQRPSPNPGPLKLAADERGLPVHVFANYGAPEALAVLKQLGVDLGIMAYVTQFVTQSFCRLPRFGMIQFHPSLLPRYRGPSAMNWAIIEGKRQTGLTIFRPVDGLDEGPILMQREVAIGPADTAGAVYFDHIFPLGVTAMVETAEAIIAGRARETAQDELLATYQGWVREAESRIDWAKPVDQLYDLIRGCNPAPGAWTLWDGRRLQIFDARRSTARSFGAVRGLKLGQVTAATAQSFTIFAQGGFIEVLRCRIADGKKIPAGEAGIIPGIVLGG